MTIGLIALIGHAGAQEKTAPRSAQDAKRFSFADVRQRAAALARQPVDDARDMLPQALRKLTYDQYRDIRFRPEKALWRNEDLLFQVQFFQRASFKTSFLDKVVNRAGYRTCSSLSPTRAPSAARDPTPAWGTARSLARGLRSSTPS
jgi:glucans biosynthesis protein